MRSFLRRGIASFLLCTGLSSLGQAADRPNILFAIADDWSFGHAGVYGCDWVRTPNFDRLAKEGILFQRAYTPNAKCAPSRAIILTGRNSWQLENAGNHMTIFPPKFGGWVELLESNGYTTGYTGKGWGPGYARDANGKARKITGTAWQKQKDKPPARAISNNNYAGNFADFLKAASETEGKPWAFWFGTTEPHRGYEYGVGRRMGKKLSDIDRVPKYWPDNEVIRNDMLDYSIEVEHYDNHLGKIVATLEAAGVTQIAPIMQPITGRSLFDIFRSPKSGRVIPSRDHVLIGKERHDIGRPKNWGYPIRGIVKGDWLYLHNFKTNRWPSGHPTTGYLNCDGSPTKTTILNQRRNGTNHFWNLNFGKRPKEELFYLIGDADCVKNLAESKSQLGIKKSLREQLFAELGKQGDPRMFGKGDVFDNYPYSGVATDNFYERYTSGEKVRAGWVNPADFEKEKLD